MQRADQMQRRVRLLAGVGIFVISLSFGTSISYAQQFAAHSDGGPMLQDRPLKPATKPTVAAIAATPSDDSSSATELKHDSLPAIDVKPARRTRAGSGTGTSKGPFYVDFRARTAASYGHAFVWFGRSSDKKVDVAGLHPAGDEVPYMLGHIMWVPSETGASYGDLDEQYLLASYRVYLSEAQAKEVFAYIRHLQATSPVWNAETTNCTAFIGKIASFMGMKVPFHIQKPENYVNELRALNGGRQTAQLDPNRAAY